MRVKLLEPRTYRGSEYEEGAVIEVAESLGAQMILNGVAIRTTEEVSSPQDASTPIREMKKDELIAYAAEHDIDISSAKNNNERIAMIEEALGGLQG